MTVIPLSNCEATFSISDGSLEFQVTLSDLSSSKYSYEQQFLFVFFKMKPLDSNMERIFINQKTNSRVFYLWKTFQSFFFLFYEVLLQKFSKSRTYCNTNEGNVFSHLLLTVFCIPLLETYICSYSKSRFHQANVFWQQQ